MKNNDIIPEGNPFKAPENYFEELNSRIFSSTVDSRVGIKKLGLYIKMRPFFAIAASVAVLAILTYTGTKLFSPRNEPVSLSGIPVEEFSEVILNEIDLPILEEDLIMTDLPEQEQDIYENDLIDYLLLENIEINDIYEVL